MLDEIKAQELIAQGEGQHVELKREVPSKVRELSEEVCALVRSLRPMPVDEFDRKVRPLII
jgi:predicted HTH transcriptional regulator